MGISRKKNDMDMTQGNIWKILISFALPLLLGSIFQQLYNTVDSIVVGNFVGKSALAAVGNMGPIINSIICLFTGFSSGASVVLSQYYGAGNDKMVHKTVHNMMFVAFIAAVFFTVIGVFLVPYMLRLMKIPDDVFAQAKEYLTIYFYGISGILIYNICSGILRAVGDSKHPLYFLIISASTNIVLDLVFVLAFDLGVTGVALATIISQFVSSVLVLRTLRKTDGTYRLEYKKLRFDFKITKQILRIGLPTAIQGMITSFSNVFVQSYINAFGSSAMAGWTSYSKIDQLTMLPMQSLAMGVTVFMGQNLGAGKPERAKKGTNAAIIMSFISSFVLFIPLAIWAPQMVSLFNSDPEVVAYGSQLIRFVGFLQALCCLNQIFAGALRGAGNSTAPMIIMLGCFVGLRQIYLAIASHFSQSFMVVVFGYPFGWIMCSIILSLYYYLSHWQKRAAHIHAVSTSK